MRLFTNSNNINSLKLCVCADLAGVTLDTVGVAPNDPRVPVKGVLPVLECDGATLFLPGPAALCILRTGAWVKDEEIEKLETFMDWESTQLYPLCLSYFQSNTSKVLRSELIKALGPLETSLSTHSHLLESALTLADVLVWCDLYPLATDKVARKEVLDSLPSVTRWFDELHKQPQFSRCSEKFGRGLEGCKSALPSLVSYPRSGGAPAKAVTSTNMAANGGNATEGEGAAAGGAPVTESEITAAKDGWLKGQTVKSPASPSVILPQPGRRNIMITSALPYVNNVPHLGNIVGCVLSADVYARFARMRGHNVLYVCGTDEYGTSTETKAVEEGVTPRQICDKYNSLHAQIYDWFNISFDKFGRTTTEQQTEIAQQIFWDVYNAGNTLEQDMEQLKCDDCDKFLADRFVEGECPLCAYPDARGDQCDKCGKLINAIELKKPRCKLCGKSPTVRTSGHIFLDLPKVEAELVKWMDESSVAWTNNARVIAKSWAKGGLLPRCITRDLKWGTPVPLKGYEDKVFYVWFDAPIGYISITAQYTSEWEKWWKNPENVEYWQFMAKDNVPFHSVVFPATLLATRNTWTLVNRLMSTEYLNYEDAKFSKSRGIGVFGNDAQETGIPSDIWRFYLIYTRPENQDSAFKWEDLMVKTNSELLSNLGNFVNRATKFTKDNFDSTVCPMDLTAADWETVALVSRELTSYISLLEDAREREAISAIFTISRIGNQLMQKNTPWKLVKGSQEDKARAGTVVALSINISCLLSILLKPFLPDMSAELQKQLNTDMDLLPTSFTQLLPPGHKINEPRPLVAEIKAAQIEDLKKRYAGQQKAATPPKDPAPVVTGVDPAKAVELEEMVNKKGGEVRDLKAAKAEKGKIDASVAELLDLKKRLCIAQGVQPEPPKGKKGKKK